MQCGTVIMACRTPLLRGMLATACSRQLATTSTRALHIQAARWTWRVHRMNPFPVPEQEPNIDQARLNRMARRAEAEARPYDKKFTEFRGEYKRTVEPVKVILLTNIPDFGSRGQIVTIDDPALARKDVLLPGFGVYASEENLELYKSITIPEEELKYSSDTVRKYLYDFRRIAVPVSMNTNSEWTLQPWHLKVCFARINIRVPERCIELPPWPITGPGPELDQKHFVVHVTCNDKERVPIRCCLHMWSDNPKERVRNPGWQHKIGEPLFEEQRELLMSLPRNAFGYKAEFELHLKQDRKEYARWNQERTEALKKSVLRRELSE